MLTGIVNAVINITNCMTKNSGFPSSKGIWGVIRHMNVTSTINRNDRWCNRNVYITIHHRMSHKLENVLATQFCGHFRRTNNNRTTPNSNELIVDQTQTQMVVPRTVAASQIKQCCGCTIYNMHLLKFNISVSVFEACVSFTFMFYFVCSTVASVWILIFLQLKLEYEIGIWVVI